MTVIKPLNAIQIREQLAIFLDGHISLSAFEDWLVQNTWNVHQSGSVAAEDLTFAVEESLSAYSSKHISEVELRSELGDLIHEKTKSCGSNGRLIRMGKGK